MKFQTKVFLQILLFSVPTGIFHAHAQIKDSVTVPVDSSRFYYFNQNGFPYGNAGLKFPLKNSLDDVQDYRPRMANTGNAGSPEKILILPEPFINSSFRRSPNSFSYFGSHRENPRFYDSKTPYTKILFIVGQKQELNVGVIHAHPFGNNCNIAFGFNRIRSTGFYQRQSTNNTSVDLNGWYRSPGRRYALLSDLYWTADIAQENGGIQNDSDFEFANQLDRHLVPVNLSSAETRQRFRGAFLKQYWSFGNVADTISDPNDSLKVRTKISPSWAIVHTVKISDEKYIYSDGDPQSGFYANVLNDTNETLDSTYLWKLQNGLWIERFDTHNKFPRIFSGKIGVKNEVGEISNDTIYRHFNNLLADGSFKFDLKGKWLHEISGNGDYNFTGINNGDFSGRAEISSGEFKNRLTYFASAKISRAHPDFIYSNYSGNHFSWKNDFYQSDIRSINGGLIGSILKQPFRISAAFDQYYAPVYFGEDLLPHQYIGTINALSAKLNWLTGTKSLKIKTDFTWNNLPSNSPIRLPEFIVRESLYGNFHLFKSALQLQVGVDATWFSAYYADAYNPNISQFYLQDTKEIGNYVFLDPWVSIKVKPVRIFVKADHVNAGMMGRNYYLIPHYPQNDFALKFGLSWVFND
jgi:hypothetical protein